MCIRDRPDRVPWESGRVHSKKPRTTKYYRGNHQKVIVTIPVSYTHLDVYKRQDEMFKDTNDNWWMANRHNIQNFTEFQKLFKSKYWSETTQNIVRDNLCNGKYEPAHGQALSLYFLGARNLEPRIPEECLVTRLAHHYSCLLYTSRCV